MRAIDFYQRGFALTLVGVGMPLLVYLALHGPDAEVASVLLHAVLCASGLYLATHISQGQGLTALERAGSVVDGSELERRMALCVLYLPLALGACAVAALLLFDNPLARCSWIIISTAGNAGTTLAAWMRLQPPRM